MVVTLPILLILAGLLAASALSSAAEAAFLSINKVRLRHLVEQGGRRARVTYELLTQIDRVIGTLLLTNNLVNVAISAIISWLFVQAFGSEQGIALATLVAATVLLVIGELTPKTFAVAHPEAVAFLVAYPLRVLMRLLYPVSTFFTAASRWLLRFVRVPVKKRLPLVTEEEIKVMIQMGREAGVLAEDELRMLHRIFEFSDSVVQEAMVPRAQISGIDMAAKAMDALDILIEEGHARIPVYEGSLDHVIGVVYARDLLAMVRHGGLFVLQDLIRPIRKVEETKRVAELLSEFQRDKVQIAIVTDAAGNTTGLITIEDLLEEIVGEIHEEQEPKRG